jgi:ADP-ribose pyrophosphatase YjhB (NUDIX family)
MIYKKRPRQPDSKTHPLIGLLLFLISILLLAITGPLGFIYGILHSLFTRGVKGLGEYLLQIAISIDQLGNVLMQHLLNLLWIKPGGGYAFGNRDETISSALGRNKRNATLSVFGRWMDALLDRIDPNHTLNSIDYYIEPRGQIIEAVCWVCLHERRVLCSRSEGKTRYYIPGGKPEEGESETQALIREIKEEMGVRLEPETIEPMGVFEAQADGHPPGIQVRLSCYRARFEGTLRPVSEIRELVWLTYSDRNLVAPVDQLIFDFLNQRGELS